MHMSCMLIFTSVVPDRPVVLLQWYYLWRAADCCRRPGSHKHMIALLLLLLQGLLLLQLLLGYARVCLQAMPGKEPLCFPTPSSAPSLPPPAFAAAAAAAIAWMDVCWTAWKTAVHVVRDLHAPQQLLLLLLQGPSQQLPGCAWVRLWV